MPIYTAKDMDSYYMPIEVFNAEQAVVEEAKQFVEDNKDDLLQDDTESGYRGASLLAVVEKLLAILEK